MNKTIQISIKNELGEFFGEKLIVDNEQYENILKLSREFYNQGGFEIIDEQGSFLIFAPEIVKKSILKISTIK